MQDIQKKITVGWRFWSDTFSLKAIASRFPNQVQYIYDLGEPMQLSSGEFSTQKASRHYLALKERQTNELAKVPVLIKQCFRDLWRDAYVGQHVRNTLIETSLWVTVFGTEKTDFETLGIELEPFGGQISLIVENYTSFNDAGQPERWLIEADMLKEGAKMGNGIKQKATPKSKKWI